MHVQDMQKSLESEFDLLMEHHITSTSGMLKIYWSNRSFHTSLSSFGTWIFWNHRCKTFQCLRQDSFHQWLRWIKNSNLERQ